MEIALSIILSLLSVWLYRAVYYSKRGYIEAVLPDVDDLTRIARKYAEAHQWVQILHLYERFPRAVLIKGISEMVVHRSSAEKMDRAIEGFQEELVAISRCQQMNWFLWGLHVVFVAGSLLIVRADGGSQGWVIAPLVIAAVLNARYTVAYTVITLAISHADKYYPVGDALQELKCLFLRLSQDDSSSSSRR